MKRIILAISAMICIGVGKVNAQESQDRGPLSGIEGINFGAKAGLNVSTFLGKDFVDITPKAGAYIGGLVEIPVFSDDFYVQPEILISFQGADVGPGNLNLTYVHLPVMAKYHITDAFAAEFGPQVGFLLGDSGEDFGSVDTRSFHFGLNLGGGYRLNENLYFQARYGLGLSKVIENSDLRNGILSLGACYFF